MSIFYKFLLFQICITLLNTQDYHQINDLFDNYGVKYNKDLYSGYLKTDLEGNELFYIFAPSQNDPKNDPFLLWLKGGPGCSSLVGFLTEIGPVTYNKTTKKFEINKESWNMNANVLFVESPAGVGFTKIKESRFFLNDTIQAISLNIALQNFFALFSQYQKNDFYITGEAYAGTYIPHLVYQMMKYFEENPDSIKLNMKGFLIGNPYTMEITDFEDSMVEFGFSHALIGYKTFINYLYECPHLPQKEIFVYGYEDPANYTFDPVIQEGNIPMKNVTKKCNEVRNEIKKQFDGINFYGILKECPSRQQSLELNSQYKNIDYEYSLNHSYQNNFFQMVRRENLKNYLQNNNNPKNQNNNGNSNESLERAIDFFPSCGKDLYYINFLNDNSTKIKLGVNETMIFKECLSLNYKWGESIFFYKDVLPKLKGFKAWIYSGTEDIAVTALGTLRWINYINYTVDEEWKPWYLDKQVAGMEQTYTSGLKFITVKGYGHMIPEENPRLSKIILNNFLNSKS
jgi:carboxypeptidase C (cathepsin A)